MHPMPRPPFSPACFLQKFHDARKPPLKLKTKYAIIPGRSSQCVAQPMLRMFDSKINLHA